MLTFATIQLVLTALNSSKSAYASFSLDKTTFFEEYDFGAARSQNQHAREDGEPRFTCQMYNKV